MMIGNFEFDYTDGEICYKTSIDVEDDRLTTALIKCLVYTNVMMDKYLPWIINITQYNSNNSGHQTTGDPGIAVKAV
ncbi:MAG: hypothetical protein KDE19_23885 [Caldilineaceae bacterium]|nr:hypothetical protein [Caldilineaceae bacterium]